MNKAKRIKRCLKRLIVAMEKESEKFVKNAGKDFTRKRKLTFGKMMEIIIFMSGGTIFTGILGYLGIDKDLPSISAFVQQREKILPEAFKTLLKRFTDTFCNHELYKGYRLLAADGTDLHIPYNPKDSDSYISSGEGKKGYNLLNINALYDLKNGLYIDVVIQSGERKALSDMIKHSDISEKTIITVDRGYEGHNVCATIEQKGWKYVARVKDKGSNGIISGLKLPDEDEFDINVRRIITRKQTKEIKANRELYMVLPNKTPFDYINDSNEFYTMYFRVVRIKISDNKYETLVTNLDGDFSPEDIKEIYSMRWGIETAFRELKYILGLINIHSRKTTCISQEIYANMILYNFSKMISIGVGVKQKNKSSKKLRKHEHKVNFAKAVAICRKFFLEKEEGCAESAEELISRSTSPIRLGRKYKRNIKTKKVISFNYRT